MRKTWILVGIVMLLFTSYQIATTYAKYITEATATVEKQAGAWVIKLNNKDISNSNSETTFDIDELIFPENEFVVEGKLAPSSSGYFDVVIDPTGSSVAVRFDVTLDVSGLSAYEAINFTSAYRVVDGEEVSEGMVRTADHTFSGVISLDDVKNGIPSTMRFYIGWEEDDTEEGDESDTQLGNLKDVTTELPVNVVISQYSGETLEEYQ